MAWVGTFLGGTEELFQGIEGYFALDGVGSAGQIPTINDAITTTQVSFRAPNYLARINFFGDNLTVTTVTLSNGTQFPTFTGGTLTGIEFQFNYTLWRAIEQGISSPALYLPSLLEPSASIQLPNVSAAALGNALVQSYNSGSQQPFLNFLNADNMVFSGTNDVNIIGGFDNNDVLRGLGGNDALFGNGGNDTLDGGAGTDALQGGEGADFYLPGPSAIATIGLGDSVSDGGVNNPNDIDTVSYQNATAAVVIDLNFMDGDQSAGWAKGAQIAGIERVIGSAFSDVIYGTDFPESIQDTAADTLEGGAGDDTLVGFGGSDFLQGGLGFDVLVGGQNGDISNPGPGDVAVFNASSAQVDVFFNGGNVFVHAPGGGLDQLIEMEFLGLTDGIFAIGAFAASAKGLFVGDGSNQTLSGSSGADLIFGRSGNDTLLGGSGRDALEGENGNDRLDGGSGADTMIGGDGSDTYIVDNAGDSVTEFSEWGGTDTVFSSVSFALGAAHIERLELTGTAITGTGNDLANRLTGNARANTLDGGAGADTLIGGAGNDTYIVRTAQDSVVETSGNGTDTVRSLVTYSLGAHQERLTLLGNAQIDGTGNGLANRIEGNGVANTLSGSKGKDTLFGAGGNDTLNGGGGADVMNGGPGSDRFIVNHTGDRVVESRSWAGTDTVDSAVDFRMGAAHIENLNLTGTATLGAGNGLMNRITGNDGNNTLDGGKNVDTLVGGLGNDLYIVRSPGDNIVEGYNEGIDAVRAYRSYALDGHVEKLYMQNVFTAGGAPANLNGIGNGLANTIIGTPYDNTIVGREGNDILKGQAGDDTFVFDRAIGAGNVDRIIDFETIAGDNDTLKIKGALLGGGLSTGVLANGHFRAGTAAGDGNDRFIFDQASGQLWFDADGIGGGAQVLVATFEQNATVQANDILIF